MKIKTRRSARPQRSHCLYCKGSTEERQSTQCGGCKALYHPDCLRQELRGKCATPGCSVSLQALEQSGQSARDHEWPACLYCNGPIEERQQSTKCGDCEAPYHSVCLSRALDRRCATPTCGRFIWGKPSRAPRDLQSAAQRNSLSLVQRNSLSRASGIGFVAFVGTALLGLLSGAVLGDQHWLSTALTWATGALLYLVPAILLVWERRLRRNP